MKSRNWISNTSKKIKLLTKSLIWLTLKEGMNSMYVFSKLGL
jgi:hypothetical protein